MNPAAAQRHALVLFSGGQDSTTCLAWALERYERVETVGFDYGQRHRSELDAAARVAASGGALEHRVIKLDLTGWGGSALTDACIDVPTAPTTGIPVTYVPARNTIFLSIALAWAETLGAANIFAGMNAVDYSGYPDCRPAFISAFEHMANLATKVAVEGKPFHIRAPLIDLTKAQIIAAGSKLGVDYGLTVSCYQADHQGRACGVCDSCRLRRAGFAAAGVADPTAYIS